MIVVNERESALECTVCGELEGVSAKGLANAAGLEQLRTRVALDHFECECLADDPKRAKNERQYKVRMRAEMRALLH